MRIKLERIKKGLTQRELSEALGWQQSKVSRVESHPDPASMLSYREMMQLCDYLGLQAEDLEDWENV